MTSPDGLFEKIVIRVEQERERTIRRKHRLGAAFLLLVAAVASIPLLVSLVQQIQESAFFTYLSFSLSDTSIVLAHWQSYVAGLIETAPLLPFTGLLSIIFILLLSLRLAERHYQPSYVS